MASKLGEGSTFTLHTEVSREENEHEQEKIMIVDDEPKIVRFVAANLKSLDFDTLTCQSGAEALEKAEEFDPDLILLDLMMPGMDGFDVLKDCAHTPASRSLC